MSDEQEIYYFTLSVSRSFTGTVYLTRDNSSSLYITRETAILVSIAQDVEYSLQLE